MTNFHPRNQRRQHLLILSSIILLQLQLQLQLQSSSVSAFTATVSMRSMCKCSSNNNKLRRSRLRARKDSEDDGTNNPLADDDKWLSKLTRRRQRIDPADIVDNNKEKGGEDDFASSFTLNQVFKTFGGDSSASKAEVDRIERELTDKRQQQQQKKKQQKKKKKKKGMVSRSSSKDVAKISISDVNIASTSANWMSSTFKLNSRSTDEVDITSKKSPAKKGKISNRKSSNREFNNFDSGSNKTSPIEAISKRIPAFGRSRDKETVAAINKNTNESSNGGNNNPLSAVASAWSSAFNSNANEWVVVAQKTEIDPGQTIPVFAAGLDLLLIASRDGKKLNCVANACSHFGTPLETGLVQKYEEDSAGVAIPSARGKECITCPLHQTVFDIETGQVVGQWCPHPPGLGNLVGAVKQENKLPTFETRIRGKNIEVRISSSLESPASK